MMFEQLGLIGCGLMGGSFALALKRAGLVKRVVGYSKSPSTVERAKALRPCASLACPHLAANPQLRGKVCSGCRTLRYCCAEEQAQDWKAGGHRAACRLLRDAGSGEGGGV